MPWDQVEKKNIIITNNWRVQVPSESFFKNGHVYVQLFHFNSNEKNLFIAIKVKLLNLHIRVW